jgi:hypothetical protein
VVQPVSATLIIDAMGSLTRESYPGLMCDVESYIYMPLLEELGYASLPFLITLYRPDQEVARHAVSCRTLFYQETGMPQLFPYRF